LIDKEKLEEQRKVKEELEKRAGEDSQEIEIEDSGILESKNEKTRVWKKQKKMYQKTLKLKKKLVSFMILSIV
jgi:hypothetical protein